MLPYYINREFNTGILEGIQDTLTKQDYMALIISVDGTKEDIKHSHQLIERRVDGVIFRPHPMGESDAYLRELMRHHVPLVSVVDVEQSLKHPLDFVGVDEAAHGRMAAEHLLELGHRRIGFTRIGDARFDVPLKERHREFVATVKKAGGEVVDTPQSDSPDFDPVAVRALLTGRKRPTAVFCSVDDIAFKTLCIARSLGLSVPGDLSILGSANYEAGQYVDPALTTFDLHPMDIGRQAGEILLGRVVKNPKKRAVSRIHVSPRLVSRGSTAPANP
jgi:LacI family transcriptional regulator